MKTSLFPQITSQRSNPPPSSVSRAPDLFNSSAQANTNSVNKPVESEFFKQVAKPKDSDAQWQRQQNTKVSGSTKIEQPKAKSFTTPQNSGLVKQKSQSFERPQVTTQTNQITTDTSEQDNTEKIKINNKNANLHSDLASQATVAPNVPAIQEMQTPLTLERYNGENLQKPNEPLPKGSLNIFASLPIISFLTGHLEQIEPESIPKLVTNSKFLDQAFQFQDIQQFLEKPQKLAGILTSLGIPQDITAQLQANGVDPAQQLTYRKFFDAVGVDAERIISEINLLRDNLPLEGLSTYMVRAAKLQAQTKFAKNLNVQQQADPLANTINIDENNLKETEQDFNIAPMALASSGSKLVAFNPTGLNDRGPVYVDSINGQQLVYVTDPSQNQADTNLKGFTQSGLPGEPLNVADNEWSETQDELTPHRAHLMAAQANNTSTHNINPQELAFVQNRAFLTTPTIPSQQSDLSQIIGSIKNTKPLQKDLTIDIDKPPIPIITTFETDTASIKPQRSFAEELNRNLLIENTNFMSRQNLLTNNPELTLNQETTNIIDLKTDTHDFSAIKNDKNEKDVLSIGETKVKDYTPLSPNVIKPLDFTNDRLTPLKQLATDTYQISSNKVIPLLHHKFKEQLTDEQLFNSDKEAKLLDTTSAQPRSQVDHAPIFQIPTPQKHLEMAPKQNISELQHNFKHTVIEHATMLVNEGGGTVKIDFGSTPHLGQIQLALDLKDQRVDLKIQTSSEYVRDLLNQEIPKLRDSLASQNLTLNDVQLGVNVGHNSHSNQQFSFNNFADQNGFKEFNQFAQNQLNQNAPERLPDNFSKTKNHLYNIARLDSHNGRISILV